MKNRIITSEQIENFYRYLCSEERTENTVTKYLRDIAHLRDERICTPHRAATPHQSARADALRIRLPLKGKARLTVCVI